MKQLYGKNNCTADSIKFFNTAEVNYVTLQMKARLSVTTKLRQCNNSTSTEESVK